MLNSFCYRKLLLLVSRVMIIWRKNTLLLLKDQVLSKFSSSKLLLLPLFRRNESTQKWKPWIYMVDTAGGKRSIRCAIFYKCQMCHSLKWCVDKMHLHLWFSHVAGSYFCVESLPAVQWWVSGHVDADTADMYCAAY